MKYRTLAGTAAIFLAVMTPVYGQKDEKDKDQQQQQKAPAQQRQAQAPQQQRQQDRQAQAPQQQRQQDRQAQAPQQQRQQDRQAKAPQQQRQQQQPQAKTPQQQQQQQQPQAKTPQQQQQQRQQRQPRAQAPQQQRPQQAPHPERTQQQAKSWQQQRGWQQQGARQPYTSFQQGRDANWGANHRDWNQRGGYGGAYIPQASFGIYFGSAHPFRIRTMPVMYMGYPRFAYGGYSFLLVDPWPDYWANDWYMSDDVYIDYDDGYYFYNRRHPGIRLAITLTL